MGSVFFSFVAGSDRRDCPGSLPLLQVSGVHVHDSSDGLQASIVSQSHFLQSISINMCWNSCRRNLVWFPDPSGLCFWGGRGKHTEKEGRVW